MINLNDAFKIADEYFKKQSIKEIGTVLESNEYFIFYQEEKELRIGNFGLKVSKENGELQLFVLPSDENFKILEEAKIVNINK